MTTEERRQRLSLEPYEAEVLWLAQRPRETWPADQIYEVPDSFEWHWKRVTGEGIDCMELRAICSPDLAASVDTMRAQLYLRRRLRELHDEHVQSVRALLRDERQQVPGVGSMKEIRRRDEDSSSGASFMRRLEAELGRPWHYDGTEYLLDLDRLRSKLEEPSCIGLEEPGGTAGRPAEDALGSRGHRLALWYENHAKENPYWPALAKCFEWHGCTIEGPDPGRALRTAVERARKRLIPPHVNSAE